MKVPSQRARHRSVRWQSAGMSKLFWAGAFPCAVSPSRGGRDETRPRHTSRPLHRLVSRGSAPPRTPALRARPSCLPGARAQDRSALGGLDVCRGDVCTRCCQGHFVSRGEHGRVWPGSQSIGGERPSAGGTGRADSPSCDPVWTLGLGKVWTRVSGTRGSMPQAVARNCKRLRPHTTCVDLLTWSVPDVLHPWSTYDLKHAHESHGIKVWDADPHERHPVPPAGLWGSPGRDPCPRGKGSAVSMRYFEIYTKRTVLSTFGCRVQAASCPSALVQLPSP